MVDDCVALKSIDDEDAELEHIEDIVILAKINIQNGLMVTDYGSGVTNP
jgi:hypothetical protein